MSAESRKAKSDELTTLALARLASARGSVSVAELLLIKEAVASTMLEHPEWGEVDDA